MDRNKIVLHSTLPEPGHALSDCSGGAFLHFYSTRGRHIYYSVLGVGSGCFTALDFDLA